jgi:hypothetical protein
MLKLKIAVFTGALAFASLPALAVDLPDYGSKNFSPADDTPAYLANESVPVAARTADTTERDWSEVDAMAPARSSFGHSRWGHRTAGRRGRYGFAHASASHAAPHFDKAVWGHAKSGSVNSGRAASFKHSRSGSRHASGAATHPGA